MKKWNNNKRETLTNLEANRDVEQNTKNLFFVCHCIGSCAGSDSLWRRCSRNGECQIGCIQYYDAQQDQGWAGYFPCLAPGDLPLDSSNNVVETAPGLTHIDGIPTLEPNATQDLVVTLQPGNYVAICDLPGHYQAGMYAGFTVQ